MIDITKHITIREEAIKEDFIRSPGPGGQHVNKTATAVQLRFDISASSLPEEVKKRLFRLAKKRVTNEGILVIKAQRFRSQERNRQDARDRLVELVRQAVSRPTPRKHTQPSQAAKRRRVHNKRHRGRLKQLRTPPSSDE